MNGLTLLQQIKHLEGLLSKLKEANSLSFKVKILNEQPLVYEFYPSLLKVLPYISEKQEFALKSLLAVGQGPIVFRQLNTLNKIDHLLKKLLDVLLQLEKDYHSLGGIIGYHLTVLNLIFLKKDPLKSSRDIKYYHPQGKDISKNSPEVNKYVDWGVEALPLIGEIYPVGGAGDRLGLCEKKNRQAYACCKIKISRKKSARRAFPRPSSAGIPLLSIEGQADHNSGRFDDFP